MAVKANLPRSLIFSALKYLERYTRKCPNYSESLSWMKLDALVSLRLAMKHNETQELHMRADFGSRTSSSSAIPEVEK
jgi:hypothetical protein